MVLFRLKGPIDGRSAYAPLFGVTSKSDFATELLVAQNTRPSECLTVGVDSSTILYFISACLNKTLSIPFCAFFCCCMTNKNVILRTAMTATQPAYLEFIDFIAAGTTPEQIIAFRPSPTAQNRVKELIAQEKEDGLSPEEQAELDHFFHLEHILRVAKARAEQILARAS